MAGRPKQALAVVQGKGRSKHLTKAEITKREEQEEAVRGHSDKVEPPSYLTKPQKAEFVKIANELMRLRLFSNLDVDGLARYIDSRHEYVKVTKQLRTMKPVRRIDNEKQTVDDYAKLQRTKNLLFNECKAAASELGLSITARLKLIIPVPDEPKHTASEFEKRFGDL